MTTTKQPAVQDIVKTLEQKLSQGNKVSPNTNLKDAAPNVSEKSPLQHELHNTTNTTKPKVAPPVPPISERVTNLSAKKYLGRSKDYILKLLIHINSHGLYKEGIDYLYDSITNTNLVDLGVRISESDKQALITISNNINSGSVYRNDSSQFKDVVDIIEKVFNQIDEQLKRKSLNVDSSNEKPASTSKIHEISQDKLQTVINTDKKYDKHYEELKGSFISERNPVVKFNPQAEVVDITLEGEKGAFQAYRKLIERKKLAKQSTQENNSQKTAVRTLKNVNSVISSIEGKISSTISQVDNKEARSKAAPLIPTKSQKVKDAAKQILEGRLNAQATLNKKTPPPVPYKSPETKKRGAEMLAEQAKLSTQNLPDNSTLNRIEQLTAGDNLEIVKVFRTLSKKQRKILGFVPKQTNGKSPKENKLLPALLPKPSPEKVREALLNDNTRAQAKKAENSPVSNRSSSPLAHNPIYLKKNGELKNRFSLDNGNMSSRSSSCSNVSNVSDISDKPNRIARCSITRSNSKEDIRKPDASHNEKPSSPKLCNVRVSELIKKFEQSNETIKTR